MSREDALDISPWVISSGFIDEDRGELNYRCWLSLCGDVAVLEQLLRQMVKTELAFRDERYAGRTFFFDGDDVVFASPIVRGDGGFNEHRHYLSLVVDVVDIFDEEEEEDEGEQEAAVADEKFYPSSPLDEDA